MGWFEDKMESHRIETAETLARAFDGIGIGEHKVTFAPHVSDDSEVLVVRCGGGYIVAYPTGDPGCYSEVGIDFVAEDGRAMQLAVVGKDENDDDWPSGKPDGYQSMHVYTYENGEDAQPHYFDTESDNYYNYCH